MIFFVKIKGNKTFRNLANNSRPLDVHPCVEVSIKRSADLLDIGQKGLNKGGQCFLYVAQLVGPFASLKSSVKRVKGRQRVH